MNREGTKIGGGSSNIGEVGPKPNWPNSDGVSKVIDKYTEGISFGKTCI